jgi:hypothetical protein
MLREGETGLPNELWSSDHVALMAEFRAMPTLPLPLTATHYLATFATLI